MKTLLLEHTKISAFLLTILICLCVFFVGKSFYQETHYFAKKGNAPISLKVLALSQVVEKSNPLPSKKREQKPQTQQKTQNKQEKIKEKKTEVAKAMSNQDIQKSVEKEWNQERVNQSKEEGEEQERGEGIELIASVQGKHFELYERVYGAILKNVFYPKKARYRKLSGVVVVEFVLERDGGISQERVVQSSGYALLDESAIKTLNQTQFPTSPKRYRFRVPLRYG